MSMPPAGRPEAAAAIWRWNETDATSGPSARALRIRGALQAAVGAGVGALLIAYGPPLAGAVVLGIAALLLAAALLSPTGLYAAIQRPLQSLGRGLGSAVNWILLVPLFYGFFLPFGVLLRRGRRDRLKRRLDTAAPSYWEPHAGPTAASASRQRPY